MRALNRRLMLTTTLGGIALAATPLRAQTNVRAGPAADTQWTTYGGNLANHRYAPLDQIDGENFNKLEVAWTFKTENLGTRPEFVLQGTPLLIKGKLYCTAGAKRDVICLDAATGELLWFHRSPDEGARARNAPRQLSGRGVGYWTDGTEERIIYVTIGYQMISLDARTGLMDLSFGVHGVVDLKKEIDQELDLERADIGLHSAPTIAKGVVIIGAAHTAGNTPSVRRNAEGLCARLRREDRQASVDLPHHPAQGRVRLRHLARSPVPAEEAGNARRLGADFRRRGTGPGLSGRGNAHRRPDGLHRPGNNLFAESIVAVDIMTGERKWHYQMVHHGLWD